MCLWPKWLLSQATNSQNSVSTRPTQARTRPDPQLTALFHAVLRCAVPGQDWLKWLGVHFYLLESSVSAKRLCKKMNWADKQMQQPFVFIVFMCMYVCVLPVCVSIQAHVLFIHLWTCMCWQPVPPVCFHTIRNVLGPLDCRVWLIELLAKCSDHKLTRTNVWRIMTLHCLKELLTELDALKAFPPCQQDSAGNTVYLFLE